MEGSKRLYFRPLIPEDAKRLLEIYSDAEAMQYRQNKPLSNLADALKMVENSFVDSPVIQSQRFGIIEQNLNLLIGTALIKYQIDKKECLIGYSIDKAFWRKGYGGEVAQVLVNYCREMQYPITTAWVHKNNIASIKILEQLAFTITPQNEFEDLLLFELNNSSFWQSNIFCKRIITHPFASSDTPS